MVFFNLYKIVRTIITSIFLLLTFIIYNNQLTQNIRMQNLCLFLLGIRDSLSPLWIKKILFYTHPLTRQPHVQSTSLFGVIFSTLIQVVIIYILLPFGLEFIGQYLLIFKLIYYYALTIATFLTYGYTFMYFNELFSHALNIVKWNRRISKQFNRQFSYGELQTNFTTPSLENKIKSIIFLAFYGFFYLLFSLLIIRIPYLGMTALILSEAFFNGIFYFLRKWPYDEFNVAFIEKNWAYLLGYGLAVSILANYIFKDNLLLSNGIYFLMSVWLIINSIVSSPPNITVNSLGELIKILFDKRNVYTNSYNTHRKDLNQREYRENLMKSVRLLRIPLKITEFINNLLGSFYLNNRRQNNNQ